MDDGKIRDPRQSTRPPPMSALEKYGYIASTRPPTEEKQKFNYSADDDDDDDDDLKDTGAKGNDSSDDLEKEDPDNGNEDQDGDKEPFGETGYEAETDEADASEAYETEEEEEQTAIPYTYLKSSSDDEEERDNIPYPAPSEMGLGLGGNWIVVKHTDADGEEEEDVDDEYTIWRETRIDQIRQQKIALITEYLRLMKILRRLKRHNIYVQDYLYKVCLRKNMFQVDQVDQAQRARQARQLKRQKKRADEKMNANFQDYVNHNSKTPEESQGGNNTTPFRSKTMKSIAVKKLTTLNKDLPQPRRVSKMCRKKNMPPFRPYRWFENGHLKGRTYSGNDLIAIEKQQLIAYVNAAIVSNSNRRRAEKLRRKRQGDSIFNRWIESLARIYVLLQKKKGLEKEHESVVKEKFVIYTQNYLHLSKTSSRKTFAFCYIIFNKVDWSLWEKRNELSAQGLSELFKAFIYQSYYIDSEAADFHWDIIDFDAGMGRSLVKLMEQLMKMYKLRLRVNTLQRKINDTSDKNLLEQGLTMAYFEQLDNENMVWQRKLQQREKYLDNASSKIVKMISTFVTNRDTIRTIQKSVRKTGKIAKSAKEGCLKRERVAREMFDKYPKLVRANKSILLQCGLMEKPHMLKDFAKRKMALEPIDHQKRALARRVYLGERELHNFRIKEDNILRNVQENNEKNEALIKIYQLGSHKSKTQGGLRGLVDKNNNNCGNGSDTNVKPAWK